MKSYSLFALIFVLSSCAGNTEHTTAEGDTTVHKSGQPSPGNNLLDGCYMQAIQRDTIRLELRQLGDSVGGTMEFDNYEKDSSHGTVKGYRKDKRVYLWYDYFSEGMQSVMEVVLEQEGGGLVRATAPMINSGDSVMFSDHGSLSFDRNQILGRQACQ